MKVIPILIENVGFNNTPVVANRLQSTTPNPEVTSCNNRYSIISLSTSARDIGAIMFDKMNMILHINVVG